MSNPQNEEIEPVSEPNLSQDSAETVELSVGAKLREAREAKQLELRDVALKTRQSQDTLAALEAEETDHIPASILRLQARNYARFLGLPEDDIVAAFADERNTINPGSMPAQSSSFNFPTRSVAIVGGAFVGLAVIVGAVSVLVSSPDVSTDDPLAISARLAPAFEREASVSVLSADAIEEFSIKTSRKAWIEVRGSDGTVFRSREMRAGETYYPRIEAGWTITVRDAGAFEWHLGNRPVGTIGEADQALFSVSVDDARLAAIEAQTTALAEAGKTEQGRR